MLLALLHIPNARRQDRQGLRLVLVLRAIILAFDDDPRRQMGNPYRRIRLVDVLSARTGSAVGVDANFGRVDVHLLKRVGLGHHRHRARRSVDATLRFRVGNPLHAMGP